MTKQRGFELISYECWPTVCQVSIMPKYSAEDKIKAAAELLPERATKNSAGYDIKAACDVIIMPGATANIPTLTKAYMQPDEVLSLHVRSSTGIKKNCRLANTTGIIDSDYYSNPDNDGHISVFLTNCGEDTVHIYKGDRIAQAIFTKFLKTDDDCVDTERVGGTGSTGR